MGDITDTQSGGGGREGQVGVMRKDRERGGRGGGSSWTVCLYLTPPRAGANFSLFDKGSGDGGR